MSRIRSKNSKLDLAMKEILQDERIEFEMYPKIPGNPDFLIPSKVVLFCDSGFWHGRNWSKLRMRLSEGNNSDYWITHIIKNRRRDRIVNRTLKNSGYAVLRFWDSEIYRSRTECVSRIRALLENSR